MMLFCFLWPGCCFVGQLWATTTTPTTLQDKNKANYLNEDEETTQKKFVWQQQICGIIWHTSKALEPTLPPNVSEL